MTASGPSAAAWLGAMLLALPSLGCVSAEPPPQPSVEPVAAQKAAHLPFFDSADFTPRWLAPSEVPADFHRIPSFTMWNQHGDEVTEAHMDGKITVVDFIFTSCNGLCPRLAKSMQEIDAAIDDDAPLLLLSYSVMPETDTVEVLADYATARGLDSARWHLLTGDRAPIYHLGRQSYFIEESMGLERTDDEFLHTENLVLLDRQRRIRGVYSGTNRTSTAQLIVDARRLLTEE